MDSSQDYDVGFHGVPLLYSWLYGANIAVLVAAVRWHKYSFYIHLFIAFNVILFTLLGTLHILIDSWISPNQSNQLQKIHNIVGLVLVCWILIQIITGIVARLIKRSETISPKLCITIRKIHIISSYLIMLMSKYNYIGVKFIKGKFKPKFILYLAIDFIFIAIYLLIKYNYLTFSQTIINKKSLKTQKKEKNILKRIYRKLRQFILQLRQKNQLNQLEEQLLISENKLPIIQSQDQISLKDYVIFNDYVYDTTNLVKVHPGGQNLRKITNKRQIDRFLYGFYSPQLLKDIFIHKHTKDSLRICGYPIKKIQRSFPVKAIKNLNKAQIVRIKKISFLGGIYLLNLKLIKNPLQKQQNLIFYFQGYSKLKQFGQYFTFSILGKKNQVLCTRLYTCLWSLRNSNIKFIEKNFHIKLNLNETFHKIQQNVDPLINDSILSVQSSQSFQKCENQQQHIPLIIKHYHNGELTSRLFNQKYNKNVIISQPMGKGMAFDKVKSEGKIIFACGGTGIFPFCDFIDILFKRVKYLQDTNLSGLLAQRDPIIKQDIINKRQFCLYYAVQHLCDIPTLLLYQISELSKSTFISFTITLRINNEVPEQFRLNYTSIKLTKQLFNVFIKNHISQISLISKIYICGPKQLMYNIGKLLTDQKIPEQLYQFM